MNPDQRVEFGMRGRRKCLFPFGGRRDRVVEIESGAFSQLRLFDVSEQPLRRSLRLPFRNLPDGYITNEPAAARVVFRRRIEATLGPATHRR